MVNQKFLSANRAPQKSLQLTFSFLLAALFVLFTLWLFRFSAHSGQAANAGGGGNPVALGSVTWTRFGEDWTLDGVEMEDTRAKLLSPANFGPAGTVPFPFVISDTAAVSDSIDLAMLGNFDVFFIGWFYDDHVNAFTDDELAAMLTWVQAGGTMIITCDDPTEDAVCSYFGYPVVESSVEPITPTAAGLVHPIFNGPFGLVPTATMSGNMGYFTTTVGATVLAEDAVGQPVVMQVEDNIGCGTVILMSDIDIITDYGGITPGDAIVTSNDRFVGNLFAYAGSVVNNCTYLPIIRQP